MPRCRGVDHYIIRKHPTRVYAHTLNPSASASFPLPTYLPTDAAYSLTWQLGTMQADGRRQTLRLLFPPVPMSV